jgi:hypothetical protein
LESHGPTFLEHLQEFPKPTHNLDFLATSTKTALQQLHILTPSHNALGKIDPIMWKYMRAYASANLEMEGCGE